MTARILLHTALAMFLAGTLILAAGLIWLAAADPQVLATAHMQRGWPGLALEAAGRVLSVLW